MKEAYGYSFDECIDMLKEENEITDLSISIPEDYIIEDTSIINGIIDYVIKPCHDDLYNYLNEMILIEAMQDPNEIYSEFAKLEINKYNNEYLVEVNKIDRDEYYRTHMDLNRRAAEMTKTKNNPNDNNINKKSFIQKYKQYKPKFFKHYDDNSNYKNDGTKSKIILKLRSLYYDYLKKARREVDEKKAGFFKRIAVRILNKIDRILRRQLKRKRGRDLI